MQVPKSIAIQEVGLLWFKILLVRKMGSYLKLTAEKFKVTKRSISRDLRAGKNILGIW